MALGTQPFCIRVHPTRMDLRRTTLAALVLAVLVAAAGCGDQRQDESASVPGSPTASTSAAAPTPAAQPPTPPGANDEERIPDDFPLLDGYPGDHHAEPGGGYGSEGPGRDLKPLVLEACGTRAPSPAYVDQLRAGWTNVEDYRARQLTLFKSPRQAQEWADAVLDVYRACPQDGPEDHEARLTTVADGRLGDESGVASTLYTYLGSPRPGLTTLYVVRVGAAVLLSSSSNEGGAGPDPEQEVRDQAARLADETSGVVAAMSDLGTSEAEPSAVFGPQGAGPLRLGMTTEEVEAAGFVTIDGAPHEGYPQGCRLVGGAAVEQRLTGMISPTQGLERIEVGDDERTPDGIGSGSTATEVATAYDIEVGPGDLVRVTASAKSDYVLRLDGEGRVYGLAVELNAQDCTG